MSDDEERYGPCYVCGGPVGTFANGFGSFSGPATGGKTVYLCHPNDPDLPDCYTIFCRARSLDAAIEATHHWLQRREVRRPGSADDPGEQEEGEGTRAARADMRALHDALVALQQGRVVRFVPADPGDQAGQEDLT